jgi:hypothetical protein
MRLNKYVNTTYTPGSIHNLSEKPIAEFATNNKSSLLYYKKGGTFAGEKNSHKNDT